jgi:DNA anti-recombination protein RmuC
MIQIGIWIAVVLSLGNLVLLTLMLKRLASRETDKVENNDQDNLHSLREEVARSEREVRSEVRSAQDATANTLVMNIGELSKTLTAQLEGVRTTFDKRFQGLQQNNETSIENVRKTVNERIQVLQASK